MSDHAIAFSIIGYFFISGFLSVYAIILHLRRRFTLAKLEEVESLSQQQQIILQKLTSDLHKVERDYINSKKAYDDLYEDLKPYRTVMEKVDNAKREGIRSLSKIKDSIAVSESTLSSIKSEIKQLDKEKELQIAFLTDNASEFDLRTQGYKQPEFELEDTPAYVVAIKQLHIELKDMLRRKTAVYCVRDWQITEDKQENKRIIQNAIKLTVRAFNNECDFLISKVTWKNAEATKDKISKIAQLINELNTSFRILISDGYVNLRLREVELTRQERLKREEDRERLRQAKADEREEREAQRDYQAELRRQEKIEKEKRRLLSELMNRLKVASEEHRAAVEAEIKTVEDQLSEAMQQKDRVMAMAEHTRIGHVYVISNEGSFGKDVLKIGLTRRLEPIQRIKELSSASVPFPFEVHAMVFSEDAPTLEKKIHSVFSDFRVNRANSKKEFFKVPSLRAKEELEKLLPSVPFILDVSSREYMLSQQKNPG